MIVLAVAVLAIGARIPIPGLDLAAASMQFAQGGLERLSIFALGALPLFTVLALAEIVRLLLPRLANREGRTGRLLVGSLVLLLSALQGYGVLVALMAMGLMDETAASLVVGIAGFVGASALLIWLADAIRLPGFDSGIWLLLTIPMLAALPRELASSAEVVRSGVLPAGSLLIPVGAVVIAVGMVVAVNRLLAATGHYRESSDDRDGGIPLAVLLWPPFLANIVTGYVIALPVIAAPDLASAPWFFAAMSAVSDSVLIPLFVYGYLRLYPAPRREELRPVLTIVAAVQVLICVGLDLLNAVTVLPLLPSGGMLIACVTVLLVLGRLATGAVPDAA